MATRSTLLVGLATLVLTGCSLPQPADWFKPAPTSLDLLEVDASMRAGTAPPGTLDVALESIAHLGALPEGDLVGPAAAVDLARVSLRNPVALAQADALRAAWQLAAPWPSEPWRVDELDATAFSARTRRLEELLNQLDTADEDELIELANWLGAFRFPGNRAREATELAGVITSQALARTGRVQQAFAAHEDGSVRHALILVTLRHAGDESPVVREEALRAAVNLPADVLLKLLAGVLLRDPDSLVLLTGLETMETRVGDLPPADVTLLLEPLANSTDASLRRRVRDILAQVE